MKKSTKRKYFNVALIQQISLVWSIPEKPSAPGLCRQKVDGEMTHWCRNRKGKPLGISCGNLWREKKVSQLTEGYKCSCLLQCAHPASSTVVKAAKQAWREKTTLRKTIWNLCLILQAIKLSTVLRQKQTWQSVIFALVLVLKWKQTEVSSRAHLASSTGYRAAA